jgi:hypothetical protein
MSSNNKRGGHADASRSQVPKQEKVYEEKTDEITMQNMIHDTKNLWKDLSTPEMVRVFSGVVDARENSANGPNSAPMPIKNIIFIAEVRKLLTTACSPFPWAKEIRELVDPSKIATLEQLRPLLRNFIIHAHSKLWCLQELIFQLGAVRTHMTDVHKLRKEWTRGPPSCWNVSLEYKNQVTPLGKNSSNINLIGPILAEAFDPQYLENLWGYSMQEFIENCQGGRLLSSLYKLTGVFMPLASLNLLCMVVCRAIEDRISIPTANMSFGAPFMKVAMGNIATVSAIERHFLDFATPRFRPEEERAVLDTVPKYAPELGQYAYLNDGLYAICKDLDIDELYETLAGNRLGVFA